MHAKPDFLYFDGPLVHKRQTCFLVFDDPTKAKSCVNYRVQTCVRNLDGLSPPCSHDKLKHARNTGLERVFETSLGWVLQLYTRVLAIMSYDREECATKAVR